VIENKLTYEAQRLQICNSYIEIEGAITPYASALAAQEQIEYELLSEAAAVFSLGNGLSDFEKLASKLKLRRGLEKSSNGDLLGSSRHFNAICISTLIAIRGTDGKSYVLFEKRSTKTATKAGAFHVLPTGMFQPAISFPKPLDRATAFSLGDALIEWDWKFNVIRKYGEELFSERLPASVTTIDKIDARTPRMQALRDADIDSRVAIRTTGLVVDLLNLRPEICTVLIVRDPSWWDEQIAHIRPNWEFDSEPAGGQGAALKRLSLSNAENEYVAMSNASSVGWVPTGLAALWLGIDAARQEI
jgi:hypothetical protein